MGIAEISRRTGRDRKTVRKVLRSIGPPLGRKGWPRPSKLDPFESYLVTRMSQGVFNADTTQRFIEAIREVERAGADCVILGCTEIPLIITPSNSPLPPLDSTRLLAKYAVAEAIRGAEISSSGGWLDIP